MGSIKVPSLTATLHATVLCALAVAVGLAGYGTGIMKTDKRLHSDPVRMHMKDINGDGHEDKVFSNDSGFYQAQYNFPSQRGVAYLTLGEILENHGYAYPTDNSREVMESADSRLAAGEISDLERNHLIIEAKDEYLSLTRQWGIEREKLIEKYSPKKDET